MTLRCHARYGNHLSFQLSEGRVSAYGVRGLYAKVLEHGMAGNAEANEAPAVAATR